MDKKRTSKFPLLKSNLTREDVLAVREIVSQIIKEITDKANVETKRWIKKYLLKDHLIPFYKDENGEIGIFTPKKKYLINMIQKNFDKFKITVHILENREAND